MLAVYENQRRRPRNGLLVLLILIGGLNLWLGIRYASAPEESKRALCAETLSPSDLSCSVQSDYDKNEAGTWWAFADGGLLFIVLAVRHKRKSPDSKESG